MSREIKFRAWDLVLNRMKTDFFVAKWDDPQFHIMQYTGLKDKNGVEIYEGDIVDDDFEGKLEVVWDEMYPKFSLRYPDKEWQTGMGVGKKIRKDIEVIGNIYENPELLK